MTAKKQFIIDDAFFLVSKFDPNAHVYFCLKTYVKQKLPDLRLSKLVGETVVLTPLSADGDIEEMVIDSIDFRPSFYGFYELIVYVSMPKVDNSLEKKFVRFSFKD